MVFRPVVGSWLLALAVLAPLPVGAQDLRPLAVSTFPNAKALPLWAAAETGLFEKFGLKVTIDETESSKAQREKLTNGQIQIAQAAVDNALAMIKAGQDVAIVMGGESGMNDFIVQADVASFAGMKGRVLVVDSPDTAYALQARKLLAKAGLTNGVDYTMQPVGNANLRLRAMLDDKKYGGAVMNPPFSSEAQLKGMKSLGRMIDLLGPYQAGGTFLMRSWAKSNPDVLERYMKAYVTSLRWLADPANKPLATGMLMAHLKLSPAVADVAYGQLVDPAFGFTPKAKIDMVGVKNMLDIRAETEGKDDKPLDPAVFIDESYYTRAMGSL